MKMKLQVVLPMFSFLMLAPLHAQEDTKDFPVLRDPYLGQSPPGRIAEPFAFDLFDFWYRSFHSNVVFSPDGKEAYWQTGLDDGSRLQAVFESRYENGVWTRPRAAFFSSLTMFGVEDAPFISPDGNRFFFLSCRPIDEDEGGECGKENIWMMDRTEEGWSEPQLLPSVVNSLEGIHWQLSVDREGNLYFGTWQSYGEDVYTGEIYVSEYENGEYAQPEKLGPEINVPGLYTRAPFVAPDGSYLLFNRNDEARPARLFISFHRRDGEWTTPKDLSDILGRHGRNPIVTIDGKFLFFMDDASGKIQPYWMDAGFIGELRESELGSQE
ncbi:hypothetical protein ACGF5M_01055 [Gemmatimonadota bacterium]